MIKFIIKLVLVVVLISFIVSAILALFTDVFDSDEKIVSGNIDADTLKENDIFSVLGKKRGYIHVRRQDFSLQRVWQ